MATQKTNPDPTPEQLARREVRVKALAHVITVKLLNDLKAKTKKRKQRK